MSTRNHCVSRGLVPAGTLASVYIVPPGEVFILKHIGLHRMATGTLASEVLLVEGAGPNHCILFNEDFATAPFFHFSFWTVLEPGDRLQIYSGDQELHYWVAGALLPTP